MATEIPSYVKIFKIDSKEAERLFEGNVSVSEKCDGSMMRFGINENGDLVFASRYHQFSPDYVSNVFRKAVDYIHSIEEKLRGENREIYFYCEYLNKPHHNVLNYARVPKNNLALFGVLLGSILDPYTEADPYYTWVNTHSWLKEYADNIDIDVVPELYSGCTTLSDVQKYLKTESYLGNEIVEGIVIKNYGEIVSVGGRSMPLFVKIVREEFKERHNKGQKKQSGKSKVQNFIESFCNEARWQKAVQYLRDTEQLQEAVQDIGPLCKRVSEDIMAEEEDYIKTELYNLFVKDIRRSSVRGLAEWYKDLLGNRLKSDTENNNLNDEL